ncbi:MAG: efflux RND transporter periplasmic adaptor subunit, partial [Kiritimatiellae bacterium]|nr:efflux RND transporter periplasmic adaptor subunit [Kiritimatiellia bacterium]
KGAVVVPQVPRGPITVAVRPVEERAYNLPERFVAHAEAMQEVDLLPQVDGYVKEILFKEGDIVKEGAVLYVLDDERYQAVVNQRKADLAAAEAEERRTKRYYERMQNADERGITQLERDNAEAAYERAKAAVMQAKANLVVAEYDCKKARVVAPISGQIGKTSAHVGDYVAPSKGALARIIQIDPMRVSFPLTDRAYIGWRTALKKGKAPDYRMRLLLPDGSEYGEEGAWDFDDNEMSKDTATIIMRLSFPNPDRLLIPNSYVTLLTDRKAPPKMPCVPQQAVADLSTGSQCVWVLKDDMTVEQRVVELREMSEGWMPVVSGVKTGEKVVISGLGKLGPGVKVQLAEPTMNDDLDPNYVPPVKE